MTRPARRPLLATVLATVLASALATVAMLPMAASAASAAIPVTGSGRVVEETRGVGEFRAVRLSGPIDVVVTQGSSPSVRVSADDNLLPVVETVVEGSGDDATLQVRIKRGHDIRSFKQLRVAVVTAALRGATVAGSGQIDVQSFRTPSLAVAVAGSGSVRLQGVTADDLGARIAGSGDVSGHGSAGKLAVSIAGSGDVKLDDLRADDVKVSISGSGDAAVQAVKTLAVSIAGSGDVVYRGDAAVKTSIAGSGSVRRR